MREAKHVNDAKVKALQLLIEKKQEWSNENYDKMEKWLVDNGFWTKLQQVFDAFLKLFYFEDVLWFIICNSKNPINIFRINQMRIEALSLSFPMKERS